MQAERSGSLELRRLEVGRLHEEDLDVSLALVISHAYRVTLTKCSPALTAKQTGFFWALF